MIVSCGRSSTMVNRSYMLFCSTRGNSFFFFGSTVQVGPGHISGEVATAHSDTPHSVRHRDLFLTILKSQNTFMPAVGIEHAIPACERPQNHALDRVARRKNIVHNTFQTIFVTIWSKFIIKLSSIPYVQSHAVTVSSPTTYIQST